MPVGGCWWWLVVSVRQIVIALLCQPPTTRNALNTNFYFSIHDTRGKTSHSFFRIANARAGLHIKFPALQRTVNVSVLGEAFAERSAAMRTTPVQRVTLLIHPEQRKFAVADLHTQSAIEWNLTDLGNGD